MKKIRIPFSIGDYQEGCYTVETRGDENHKPYSVRIFTVDLLSRYQTIVGAEKIENREVIGCWFNNGNFFSEDEENYQDLLLVKEEFEDGDIVIKKRDSTGCFILPYRSTNIYGGILTEVYFNVDKCTLHIQKGIVNGRGETKNYRLATEEEKKLLFDALKKEGKCWNAEKKCIEDIKVKTNKFSVKEWCLMRNNIEDFWVLCQFSNIAKNGAYVAIGGNEYHYCIPYNDETEYLLGNNEYKTK